MVALCSLTPRSKFSRVMFSSRGLKELYGIWPPVTDADIQNAKLKLGERMEELPEIVLERIAHIRRIDNTETQRRFKIARNRRRMREGVTMTQNETFLEIAKSIKNPKLIAVVEEWVASDEAQKLERHNHYEWLANRRFVLPPGRYYIGDPCYAIDDAKWHDYINAWESGRTWYGIWPVMFNTAYGDGGYLGTDMVVYSVDSGSLGVVPTGFVTKRTEVELDRLGQTYTFPEPFACYQKDGVMYFGEIEIDTR